MSALDTLISNLTQIQNEVSSKILPENIRQGVTIFSVEGILPSNCRTFATIAEMEAWDTAIEDDYAIVYGTTYIGTYRYDDKQWVQIGDSSDEQRIMDILNRILLPEEQYEGNGGTDEEISAVLDEVLNGPQTEPGGGVEFDDPENPDIGDL
jgi:hypothetical protein